MLVSCSAYFFDPEDGGEMSLRKVGTQQTTRRYIPEDGTLRKVLTLTVFMLSTISVGMQDIRMVVRTTYYITQFEAMALFS
jgi:hypothetical protein